MFDGHVGVQVDVGGADVGVAEPERDDRGVDTGLQQRHGAAVAKHVWMQRFGADGRASSGGGGGVCANEALHGVAAEASTGAGREQRLVGSPGAFGQPDPEHGLGGRGEWNGAVLAAFA